jgi:hypothetical protein
VSVRLGRTKIISTAGAMRYGNVEARVPKNKTESRRSQVQGSGVHGFRSSEFGFSIDIVK